MPRERPVRNAGPLRRGRSELDSVGVDGRAFERVAKPVKRAIGGKLNRRTAGRSPDVAPMVGDGMAGSPCDRNQGDPPGAKTAFMARRGPKNCPAGVRVSMVAKKRVMTVERRDAGKWMRNGTERREATSESGGGNAV